MKSIYLKNFFLAALMIFVIAACQSSQKLASQKSAKGATSPLAVMFDTSSVFSSNITGFALYDPVKDSMIYAQHEDHYFTPASNTKLFTFYTGLKILPDSLPALEYIVRGDSLIIWGTGDPSFLHPDFGVDTVYDFLKNSNRKIYYSDSHFNDERLGPGWAWDDYNYYYSTEKSPLPIYGNVVRFEVQEIEIQKLAKASEDFAISPSYFRPYINQMPEADGPLLYRDVDGNTFKYKPEADTLTYTIAKPFHYTPRLIVNLLADTLNKPVEYIEMEKPDSARMLYSIPADTAYKRMLQPSDNFIAEQLLYVTASQLGMPLETSRVIEYMKKNYLNDLPDEPQWADGSGLSRYNLFTPRSMISLLEKISAEFAYDENLFALLPAGGESGTISNLYASRDGGQPYVFAKTGTLSNNHCLTGFLITETGRKLLFSFMNNHYVTPTSVVHNEMEKILWYIHENF